MFELSQIQCNIIKALISNNERTLVGYFGLTGAGLKRHGVNRRSFDNNKEVLESNYLISKVGIETHVRQKWRYYDSTVLGVLTLYQNIQKRKIRINDLQRFFPIITRYWYELEKIFQNDREGFSPIDFFEMAVNQLHFEHYAQRRKFNLIVSRMDINFGQYDMSLKSEFHFKGRNFRIPRKLEVDPSFDDRDVFMKSLSEKFSFLFFFNMFHRIASYDYADGVLVVPLFGEFSQNSVEGGKLEKNYGRQIQKILSVIKADKELNQIFVNIVKFTFELAKEKPVLKFLAGNLKGKPFFKVWNFDSA